jgi:hypothetical protein
MLVTSALLLVSRAPAPASVLVLLLLLLLLFLLFFLVFVTSDLLNLQQPGMMQHGLTTVPNKQHA